MVFNPEAVIRAYDEIAEREVPTWFLKPKLKAVE